MKTLITISQISECFVKPKDVVEESKKRYNFSPFELYHISQCYLQIGLVFNKLTSKIEELNQNDNLDTKSFLDRFKESLSITLTHFYPLSGQLVTELEEDKHTSCIFLDCTKGPGAKLIHASLPEASLSDISIDPLFELGRVPINLDGHEIPLLTVQLTELVDGLFLGFSMNQTVADEVSGWHFLATLSETFMSQNYMISRPPVYIDRLYPRGYDLITLPFLHPKEVVRKQNVEEESIKESIFHLSCQSMDALKTESKISSFEALSVLVWRAITRARVAQLDEITSCAMVTNVRQVIDPPLTRDSFGNFMNQVIKTVSVGELLEKNLGEATLQLHEANSIQLKDEFVHDDCVKWIEAPVLLSPGLPARGFVVVSGSIEEDVYGIDFGLGKAVGIRVGSNKFDGKVVVIPGMEGKGSADLQICLAIEGMKALEEDQEFTSFVSFKS